jgi:TonB family protein
MYLRLIASRRPERGSVTGTLFSMAAHAALLAAVVADDRARRAPAEDRAPGAGGGGEGLHWVGVGDDAARELPRARPGAPPPIAYVVPGRGAPRERVTGSAGTRERGRPGGAHDADGAGGTPAPPEPAPEAPDAREVPRALRRAAAALPNVAGLAPDATLLVAGVLSSAPDPTRAPARPEDFVRATAGELLGAPDVTVAMTEAQALRPDVHVDDLPIPLVTNPRPRYPLALARAQTGGAVVVEFTIDSTGVVDLGSLRVVQSTHAAFTDAVRSVLPRLRYFPAQLARQPVGVTVRQPFLFKTHAMR